MILMITLPIIMTIINHWLLSMHALIIVLFHVISTASGALVVVVV